MLSACLNSLGFENPEPELSRLELRVGHARIPLDLSLTAQDRRQKEACLLIPILQVEKEAGGIEDGAFLTSVQLLNFVNKGAEMLRRIPENLAS